MRSSLWAALACVAAAPGCFPDFSGLASDCPGRAGPAAVKVVQGSSSFCIDSTEVTNAQYQEFLGAMAGRPYSGLPASCGAKASHAPSSGWSTVNGQAQFPSGAEQLPVVFVDWCDAYAYCAWAGKDLCGKPQGGAHAPSDNEMNTSASSAWFAACSQGGKRAFPYGDTYDSSACNASSATDTLSAVGSRPHCEGGYPGIFDMSGNVEEWTDACESDAADAGCLARGGTAGDSSSQVACAAAVPAQLETRTAGEAWRGFRCCSTPLL